VFHTYRLSILAKSGKIIRSQHGDRGEHLILKPMGPFGKGKMYHVKTCNL